MEQFFVGVDLGQRRDHSAVVVVERERGALLVRHVERIPLGTPYQKVVDRVRALVSHEPLRGRCLAIVDATGVGGPVIETMKNAGLGCGMAAVTITGGESESQTGSGAWSVPKRDLMAGVSVALERGELRIARGIKEAGALVKELRDIRVDRRGRMGANGTGQHDDLAIALALAVWRGAKGLKKVNLMGTQRLF